MEILAGEKCMFGGNGVDTPAVCLSDVRQSRHIVNGNVSDVCKCLNYVGMDNCNCISIDMLFSI